MYYINQIKLFILLLLMTISNGHLATKRLYEDLLSDYNRLIRPVTNNNDTVYVNLSLKLTQILDINMKQQVMSTNVWLEQNWFDFQLKWNPKEYDGVEFIFIPAEDIWTPDIVLFNNYNGNFEVTSMTKAIVYSTGEIVWRPPALFKSTCEIDVEFFPYDIQECSMKFASWTYDGSEVDLRCVDKSSSIKPNTTTSEPEAAKLKQEGTFKLSNNQIQNETEASDTDILIKNDDDKNKLPNYNKQIQLESYLKQSPAAAGALETSVEIGIDMSEFYTSVEWDILAVPAHYKKDFFPGLQNPYPDITFKIRLRRKTLFYTINLIIPIVGNAFLTLLVFYLPSDSGEKVTLSISSLVSLTVFFLLLAEIIPPTSLAIPLLGKYLLFTMILITLSICCTVGILNIHFRTLSTHIMKPWVKRFFIDTLPKYLLMNPLTIKDFQKELRALSKPNKFQFTSCADINTDDHTLRFLPKSARYQGIIQSTNTSFEEEQLNKSIFLHNNNNFQNLNLDHQTELPFELGIPDLIIPESRNLINYSLSAAVAEKHSPNASPSNDNSKKDPALKTYGKDVEQAIHSILTIAEHLKQKDEEKKVIDDWKFVAMTLDRLFLILFTFICILGTCIIITAPSLYDASQAIVA